MKNKVYLAPSIDKVEGVFEATVEAEYGADCVEGTKVTLAHHGPRAGNPAPCNATGFDVLAEGDRILISHIDLDTVGGILALTGEKPEDPEFWKAAEFIDLKGRHHMHELTPEIQDKLNAYYCFTALTKLPRFENLTDVTDIIDANKQALDMILDKRNLNHEQLIASGRVWSQVQAEKVESCLVSESEVLRVFDGRNGTPCAAGYYSPTLGKPSLATLSLNKFQGITLGLSDEAMAMGLNASQIMQTLYGPGAGGREGIAGTPRGNVYTKEDLMDAAQKITFAIQSILTHNMAHAAFNIWNEVDDARIEQPPRNESDTSDVGAGDKDNDEQGDGEIGDE